jgi:ribonuclease HI
MSDRNSIYRSRIPALTIEQKPYPKKGIVVDGFCLGNPGPGGYQGFDIATGKQIFIYEIEGITTNNIAEMAAICHAVAWMKKKGVSLPIYSDSQCALEWCTRHYVNTKLDKNKQTKYSYAIIARCEKMFLEVNKCVLKHWDKRLWGESPADFGHKDATLFAKRGQLNRRKAQKNKRPRRFINAKYHDL